MLSFVGLQNFKLIEDAKLELARLNILVGQNNSGKSSVLQAIALLKQSYLSQQSGLIYTGSYFDLEGFREIVFKRLLGSEVSISIGFRAPSELRARLIELLPSAEGEEMSFRVRAKQDSIEQAVFYSEAPLLLFDGRRVKWLGADDPNLSVGGAFSIARWGLSGAGAAGTFKLAQQLLIEIQRQLMSAFYLGPLRGITQARSPIEPSLSAEVGARGEHLVSILHYVQGNPDYSEPFSKVKSWAEKFDLSGLLATLLEGPSNALSYEDNSTQTRINLANTGFGVNQLLPVIAQCFLAPKGSLIMVEEPEGHLHPAYQALLLDFFLDAINYGNQILLTTHSEHLILRLQRRLAEKALKPEDVALYTMEKSDRGAVVGKVKLDDTGLFDKMPAGFFEEGFEESLKHVRALSQRMRKTDAK